MYRYELQPYKGPSSRYKCPGCGKAHEFARYIDTETKEQLPDHVGRCNRESSCGYHYTAAQYLKENGIEYKATTKNETREPIINIKPDFMPFDLLERSISGLDETNFAKYLTELFTKEVAMQALDNYGVGRSKADDGQASIFWNVDITGNIRTGKIICYDPVTGKRKKDISPIMVHKAFKNDFVLQLAFFGEFLLSTEPNKTVAIVESEKTAIIASIYMPSLVWLATGGASGCKWREYAVFKALQGRTVIMFPDFGKYNKQSGKTCYAEWSERAGIIRERMPCSIKVSQVLEKNIPEAERVNDYDLADMLIKRKDGKGWALTDEGYPAFWDMKY